jgi:hypothetical protein
LASGNSRKRIFAETENIFSSILLARSEENKKTLVDSNWYMHLTPNMKINIFLLSKGPIALFVARIKKKKEKKERSISSRPRDEMVQRTGMEQTSSRKSSRRLVASSFLHCTQKNWQQFQMQVPSLLVSAENHNTYQIPIMAKLVSSSALTACGRMKKAGFPP